MVVVVVVVMVVLLVLVLVLEVLVVLVVGAVVVAAELEWMGRGCCKQEGAHTGRRREGRSEGGGGAGG